MNRENRAHGCQIDDARCSGLQWCVDRESSSRTNRGKHISLERPISRVTIGLARSVDGDSIIRSKGGHALSNFVDNAGERGPRDRGKRLWANCVPLKLVKLLAFHDLVSYL